MGDLFHPEFILNANEDAANNFARGHYTIGKENIDAASELIRKLTDNSENVQGFIVNHAVGGGTGSGLGGLVLERLSVDYRKKSKIGFEIYPSPRISPCIVEAYNGLLSTHLLLDYTEVSLVLDNEALYEICQRDLKLRRPTYANINRILAKAVSSMTASLRFDGELNVPQRVPDQPGAVPAPPLHDLLDLARALQQGVLQGLRVQHRPGHHRLLLQPRVVPGQVRGLRCRRGQVHGDLAQLPWRCPLEGGQPGRPVDQGQQQGHLRRLVPHRFQDRPQRRAPAAHGGRRHRRLPAQRGHDLQQRRRQPRLLAAPRRQVRPHVLAACVRPLVCRRGYGGG